MYLNIFKAVYLSLITVMQAQLKQSSLDILSIRKGSASKCNMSLVQWIKGST